ncbi:hypothetical protein HBA55_33965 [Pseudomaricurvus alkylphenolicus]|uniref:hypothetical protein n=1 Tax=Pseudomaricurvus alkylphenolicus TaxID=1306991 RepID=UPI001420E9D5|nr:hypothetical protein [Pseudomaricurvus alkylphenolicus]NIB44639.1 hypothetical protein [Pseudomaricurvus alkylphenolicus]
MTMNEELFNAYVSEEFRKTADETRKKLEKQINSYIDEFKSHVDTVAKEAESKNYSELFAADANSVFERVNAANKRVEMVNAIAESLKAKAPELSGQIDELMLANSALKQELDSIKEKANSYGKDVGKAVAFGIKQAVTGGLKPF